MKQLALLFLILTISKSCSQSTEREQVLNSMVYSAMTRGSSYQCNIDKNNISIVVSGTSNQNKSRALQLEEWEELKEALNKITLAEIHNFEAPTEDSAFDGARIAKLLIESDGKFYESAAFDEGVPPEELKSLIDMILALAETVE